jgi:uncharacterized phage protein gp47/JayE
MALTTPTIKEIQTNIIGDIEAALGQSIPILAKAVFRILAYALAGAWIILYKFGSDAYRQRFVQTANETYLALLGEVVGVTRDPASIWLGTASIVSTGTSGTIPDGTQFILTDTGVVYTTEGDVDLSAGTLTLTLVAGESGATGDLAIGDVLDIVSPLSGVADTVTILTVTTAGEDAEEIETWRQRILDVYQKKPQGGASSDYEQWGMEAPHVAALYPYPSDTPGYVDIYVEVSDQTDGIPTTAELAAVTEYLTYNPTTGKQNRKPITAGLNLHGISRKTLNITINGLSPVTTAAKTAISAAVTSYMLAKEPYIRGLTISRKDSITKMELVSLVLETLDALSATFSNMTLYSGTESVDIYTLGTGEKAKIGIISYA